MQPEREKRFNFRKFFLIAILISILIIGGGITYLRSYFDSDKLKEMVIPKLEAALNREVEVKDIKLKFWQGVGIRVIETEIANAEEFNGDYLARVDEFTVNIALLPLLQREIKIKEVKLINPVIQLAKNESEEVNYRFGTDQESKKTDKKNPLGFLISIDKLQIIDGRLKYLDGVNNLDIDMNGIDFTAISTLKMSEENLLTVGKVGIDKLDVSGAKKINLDQIESEFDFDIGKDRVKADKLTFNTSDSKLKLAGVMDYKEYVQTGNYESLDLELDLISKLNLAEIRQLLVSFDSKFSDYNFNGELKSDLAAEFSLGDIIGEDSNLDRVKLAGGLEFNGEEIIIPNFREKLNQVEGKIEAEDYNLKLSEFHCKLDQSDLTVTGKALNWNNLLAALLKKEDLNEEAKIEVDLNSDLLVVDELLNLTSAKESKKANKESKSEIQKDIPIDGSIDIAKLKYNNLIMEDVTGDLSLIDRLFKLDNLKSNVAQGEINGRAKMNLVDGKPEYQGKLKISEVEIAQLLSSFTSFEDLYGSLNSTVNFGGKGFSQQNIKNHLTLQGEAAIADGKLTVSGVVDKLNELFNIFEEDELQFNGMKGSINLKNGKLYLNDFKSDTLQGELKFGGYSTLEGSLDYELSYLLSKDKSKEIELSQKELFYVDDGNRVQLNFNLTGDISDPIFKWDKSKVEEKAKEKAEEEVKKEIKEEENKVKDKIEKELKEKEDEVKDRLKELF